MRRAVAEHGRAPHEPRRSGICRLFARCCRQSGGSSPRPCSLRMAWTSRCSGRHRIGGWPIAPGAAQSCAAGHRILRIDRRVDRPRPDCRPRRTPPAMDVPDDRPARRRRRTVEGAAERGVCRAAALSQPAELGEGVRRGHHSVPADSPGRQLRSAEAARIPGDRQSRSWRSRRRRSSGLPDWCGSRQGPSSSSSQIEDALANDTDADRARRMDATSAMTWEARVSEIVDIVEHRIRKRNGSTS